MISLVDTGQCMCCKCSSISGPYIHWLLYRQAEWKWKWEFHTFKNISCCFLSTRKIKEWQILRSEGQFESKPNWSLSRNLPMELMRSREGYTWYIVHLRKVWCISAPLELHIQNTKEIKTNIWTVEVLAELLTPILICHMPYTLPYVINHKYFIL